MQGVPSSYIRTAKVDWTGEFLSASGGSLCIGSAVLPAPTFGVWAMLELLDCDFVHPRKESTVGGAIIAAYVAAHGRDSMPLVEAKLASGLQGSTIDMDNFDPLDTLGIEAVAWVTEKGIGPSDFMALGDWLGASFAGFSMLPSSNSGGECVFGMDSFGAILSAVGSDFGVGYDALMWDVPLVLVGHAIAQKSKQNGAKGVARPKDLGHMREQIAETKRREELGLLYEWQEKEPWRYDLDGHENEDEAYRFAVLQHEARNKGVA